MDFHEILKKYLPFLKQYWIPLSLGFFGLIFFAYGLISLMDKPNPEASGLIFESANSDASSGVKSNEAKIMVDIEGGVIKPGVYSLATSARAQDALIAASGLSNDADRNWVEKNLNLASKLVDGQKIYVPKLGENKTSLSAGSQDVVSNSSGININSASLQALADSLPGVGPATAQKIISGRPYSAIEELLSKKIVTEKVFGQIKDKIMVF
ncbi:MAG: ComEA family DNA-binding protein [Candidatus Levybacteria bacterium]|nr:ComEA family DNA-binding protein [Candidatus Levybacteria bacterium]